MQKKMQKLLCLSLCAIIFSACETIPNTSACQVAGVLAGGMVCADSITGKTSEMPLSKTIDFLEPQLERPDPTASPVPLHKCGNTETIYPCLPPRAGAICRSADDELKLKTVLEKLCRRAGSGCTYEAQQSIESLGGA